MKSIAPTILICSLAIAATSAAEPPATNPEPGRVTIGPEVSLALSLFASRQLLDQMKESPPPASAAATKASVSRSMSLLSRRPEDHTPLFRFRHDRAAAAADAKCSYCHEEISGAKRDACKDCHAVARPRSHMGNFRTTGHGRVAAQDTTKCATCHEVEYCTNCHEMAPQNHFPLDRFLVQHDRIARANPRSCQTCHTFVATCSECHTAALVNRRK